MRFGKSFFKNCVKDFLSKVKGAIEVTDQTSAESRQQGRAEDTDLVSSKGIHDGNPDLESDFIKKCLKDFLLKVQVAMEEAPDQATEDSWQQGQAAAVAKALN